MLVIPSSAVRANRSSSRAAPSSMEYSVWTWRWTKSDPDGMGGEVLLSGSCAVRSGGRAGRTHGLDGPAGGRAPAYATTPRIVAGRTDSHVVRRRPAGPVGAHLARSGRPPLHFAHG